MTVNANARKVFVQICVNTNVKLFAAPTTFEHVWPRSKTGFENI
jgi:hypothetical protein